MLENLTEVAERLLGKRADTLELKTTLSDLGANELQIDPDDGSAYVKCPQYGFSLLFRDPARIKNPVYSSLPRDVPIFMNCFYYSEGHEGYKQFPGPLPRGLAFSDARSAVEQKLGPPSWQRKKEGRIVADRWDSDSRSLHVTYKKTTDTILIISYGLFQNLST
jgi:hypothetical protein